MTEVLDALSLVTSAAGVAVLLVAVALTGDWRGGLRMALTLWMAAGLLSLAGAPSWARITGAAATVLVRQLVSRGLDWQQRARPAQ